jgi:hypothetical protein
MNKWQRRTLIAGAVLAGLMPAAAKQAGEQLSMARIETVQSPEPATVQIIFYDDKGRRVTIQAHASVAQELAARISSIGM